MIPEANQQVEPTGAVVKQLLQRSHERLNKMSVQILYTALNFRREQSSGDY
jgi:hypothetical protein